MLRIGIIFGGMSDIVFKQVLKFVGKNGSKFKRVSYKVCEQKPDDKFLMIYIK